MPWGKRRHHGSERHATGTKKEKAAAARRSAAKDRHVGKRIVNKTVNAPKAW